MEFDPKLFDPKKHFIKRRAGKVFMFDKQIRNWRKRHKKKGALKDSVTTRYGLSKKEKKIRNIFE